MSRHLIIAAAIGFLSTAPAIGCFIPAASASDTEPAVSTGAAAAAAYRPRQVQVEALGKQVMLNVPPAWTQTAKRETTGETERVHYDWKNVDQSVTLTFVAIDPPRVLRTVLRPADEAALVRKMAIATFRLNDIDVEDIVVAPSAERPHAYELTCAAKVRSRAANAYPRPHTLSTTLSRPLPLFHSRADVRSTSGSYVTRMAIVVDGENVYIGSAAAKVEGDGADARAAAAGTLDSPMVTSFLTSLGSKTF